MKHGFILYTDYFEKLSNLSDEELGLLIRTIFQYELDPKKESPVITNPIISMAFAFIKSNLDRDREKYTIRCEKNKNNAKKRWKELNAIASIGKNRNAKNADNDTDNDTDNNINNIKKKKRKNNFKKPSLEDISKFILDSNITKVDAEEFLDYYESNGWMVGRTHMKDWKATIRNWNRKNKSYDDDLDNTVSNYERSKNGNI